MYHLIKSLPEGIIIYDVNTKKVNFANISVLNLFIRNEYKLHNN
jgi:hypothetical protein